MTISIREFEPQFDYKLLEINNVPWLGIKLKLIFDLYNFLHISINEKNRFSYNTQLTYLLKNVVDQFELEELSFINPKHLNKVLNYLDSTSDSNSNKQIVFSLCKSYLRLKEFQVMIKLAQRYHLYSGVIEKETQYKSIQEFIKIERTNFNSELVKNLENETDLINTTKSSNNSINGLFAVHHGEHTSGTVATLSLMNVSISKKYGTDMVRFANHLVDENDILSVQVKDVCYIMKRYFNHVAEDYYKLEYSIDRPLSLLRGNSLGLAMALLVYTGLDEYKKNAATEFNIYSDVALTGALDKNGNISPVSKSSLGAKIEAAFFSRINSIVIPEKQVDFAQHCLTELQQEYTNREFEIIAGKSFNGVLKRHDIIFKQRRRVKKRIDQFIHDYANTVTYSIMAFLLLIAAGFWFGVVKHPKPESSEFDKNTGKTIIRNKYGFLLWESLSNSSETIITDLENDGQKEILISYQYEKLNELSGKLVCYNSIGQIIWMHQSGYEVEYGTNKYSNYFAVSRFLVSDLDNDGINEIIAAAAGSGFACRVFTLDFKGNLISEYWHSGQLYLDAIEEVYQGNGSKEIILTGINNEYRSGLLSIIDPYNVSGYSPQIKPYYQMNNRQRGNEIYYIKFPLTHYRKYPLYDYSRLLSINENGEIRLINAYNINSKTDRVTNVCIIYEFDNKMIPKMVDVCDKYYRYYSEFFPDEEPLALNDPELIKYFRQIDYWDGDNWTKERTVNKRYLETLKKPLRLP